MGKGKKAGGKSNTTSSSDAGRDSKGRHHRGTGSGDGRDDAGNTLNSSTSATDLTSRLSPAGGVWNLSSSSIRKYQGFQWVAGCIVLGWILGYAIGAGWTDFSGTVSPWRKSVGKAIRDSTGYQLITFQDGKWEEFLTDFRSDMVKWMITLERKADQSRVFERNPSHPYTFALLREAVIRENGGYVHHDLGILSPAPSGAIRGIGMVSDSYHACQTRCIPGVSSEKLAWNEKLRDCQAEDKECHETNNQQPMSPSSGEQLYKQEEVLIRVPLSFQMTRSVAIETLSAIIPTDVQTKSNFNALDDAALLVLLLAHERGLGRYSRWYPYILSLPHEPSCGYSRNTRPHTLDALEALRHELGIDVEGWSAELVKASLYADRIANGLNSDYGQYIQTPEDVSTLDNIKWGLCQVASRATAGNDEYGSLRMVPVADLVNHDVNGGGFTELTGKERIQKGDFVDALDEDDKGTFVVRSLKHGRRRPLRKGQELMVNYNVPLYTPLDWFISLGFVPPERWGPWEKVDPVLPRVRRDGPFAEEVPSAKERWEKEGSSILEKIRETESTWQ